MYPCTALGNHVVGLNLGGRRDSKYLPDVDHIEILQMVLLHQVCDGNTIAIFHSESLLSRARGGARKGDGWPVSA